MMDENAGNGLDQDAKPHSPPLSEDEAVDMSTPKTNAGGESGSQLDAPDMVGAVRTLDGELAGDEFAQDAMNYQILLAKIDSLLDRLKLDA